MLIIPNNNTITLLYKLKVMGYTLTQEERIVLSEIQSDLIKAKGNLTFSLINIVKYIIRTLRKFLLSLEDFKLENIRNHGLGEILYQRALRFFKLEEKSEKLKSASSRKESTNAFQSKKKIVVIQFMLKIAVVLLLKLFRIKNKKKKVAKNVYVDKFG